MDINTVSTKEAIEVSQTCLCLQLQKAARKVARLFDNEFRELDLSHGQFSLLMMLMQPTPPNVSSLADALAMDRTTLTANLKPLKRNGLISVLPDPKDGRSKCIQLTESGQALLNHALPRWEQAQQKAMGQFSHSKEGDLLKTLKQFSTIA